MLGILLVIIISLAAPIQSRPLPQPNFMLWNYFPFLQPQQLQMMQQVVHPASMGQQRPVQYPIFEMFFNGPIPINSNMPIIGEIQFEIPVPPTTPPPRTTTTLRPRPPTTTSTTRAPPKTKHPAHVKKTTPSDNALKLQLSKGIFEMARNIQAKILSDDSHQSTGKFNVFSPINVAAVLSLLELGTKGQTNHELQHILGFDKLDGPLRSLDHHNALGQMFESVLHPETSAKHGSTPQINMAKGIFMQTGYSLRPDYRTSVETIYQSQVTALDFEQRPALATKFINDWVRKRTNGKIGNILADGIDKSTRMMVASAVYFKALWLSSFMPEATSKRPFYPNGRGQGQKIIVDTMGNGGEFKFYESKAYDCGIMALPFKGHTATMYVILPNNSNGEKLRHLQASLTFDAIEDMISKMEVRLSMITMPKMHLSDTLDLKDVLGQLNVRQIFESGSSDFSGIVENNQISVDGFVHKVDLTINETGTEAAAATAAHLSRQEFDVEFRVDSPFMFLVRHDETKLPILYGSVMEPVSV